MDAAAFASAVAGFSTKFFNELDKTKNVVSSPLSAENLLAVLALGSTEPAHSELLEALKLEDNKSIQSAFGALTTKLKAVKGVSLNVANKMYIKDGGYDVEAELKDRAEKIFDTEFEKISFKDPAHAATLINQWVQEKTDENIKDLFSSDSFTAFTRLVLVNAIYFKGIWKTKFNAKDTMSQRFHIDNKTTVNVPMMFKDDKFKSGESAELGAQLLEMPYKEGEMSMVFILPNEKEGLNDVIKKLANEFGLMSELKKMISKKVKVSLPKFQIETEIDLKPVLKKLGIEAIFDEKESGLNEILNNGEMLHVSKAVQKVKIEVNEEGAEGSLGTGIGIVPMSADESVQPAYFRADHPFLYLLVDAERTILFIGAYRGK